MRFSTIPAFSSPVHRILRTKAVCLDRKNRKADVLVLLRDTTEQTLAHRILQENQAKLRELNEKLTRLSSTDSLTGLYNRRHFLDQLGQEFERAARLDHEFALLSIDLDNFKSVNDTYGHAAGEEFLVLLIGIGEHELESVAERFRQAIDGCSITLEGVGSLTLSASIGGVQVRSDVNMQSALRQVDDALYAAKRAGRNRVVIHNAREYWGQSKVLE